MNIADIMPTGTLRDIAHGFDTLYWIVEMLCFNVAGICGLVAGLRIYNLWNLHGRHHVHIDSQVAAWIGAAIFLCTAALFVESIFNV